MKKKQLFLGTLIASVLLLGACGASSKGVAYDEMAVMPQENISMDYYEPEVEGEYYEDYKDTGEYDNGNGITGNTNAQATGALATNRKLIKTVNLSVETQKFDNLMEIVENKTVEYDGYIEQLYTYNGSIYNSYKSYKNASLTVRIPKEHLNEFLAEVGQAGNVTDRSESVDDVTLTYVDMESRKKVLLTEEERLLSFLEQAETMEDIITIESRLSEVRYQIESMESQLRTYDNLVDYSTVYLNISEVAVLTPATEKQETIWDRMGSGFMNSVDSLIHNLQELFIGFVVMLPYLLFVLLIILILAGIVVIGVKLGMRKSNRKNTKKGEKEPAKAE